MDTPLLDRLESSGRSGLARLDAAEIACLAGEIRALITATVARNGGHLASNLGLVELVLALHRAYDFSRDRLVFDVGHQCYVHKLLTGRRPHFATLRRRGGLSGFPAPEESDADPFRVGHASTSVSSALGLALAYRFLLRERTRRNLGEAGLRSSGNLRAFARAGDAPAPRVVALIGDGALGGGLAFEAMNHAGHVRADLLVVLNDNDMAIARTVGAVGEFGVEPLFRSMGFRYFGPVSGHDFAGLERTLAGVRDLPGPRLLHVITRKGQGYRPAAADPETFHSPPPFAVESAGESAGEFGKIGAAAPALERGNSEAGLASPNSYTDVFADELARQAERDPRVLAITAAMPAGTGIRTFADRFPDRFLDVGIAEAHGVTLAAALASAGCRPVVAMYSTFLQRGFDQLVHDVALQPWAPVTLAIDRAGLVGADGPTHHGLHDIAFLRIIPGFVLMAPRDAEELRRMLAFALTLDRPTAIRYPRGPVPPPSGDGRDGRLPAERTPLALGRAELLAPGGDGAVFAYGRMAAPAYAAVRRLAKRGPRLAVVNARFATDFADDPLYEQLRSLPLWFTVEDHALAGGYGSAVAEWLIDRPAGGKTPRLTRIGVPDRPIAHAAPDELDAELGLDVDGLEETFVKHASRAGNAGIAFARNHDVDF